MTRITSRKANSFFSRNIRIHQWPRRNSALLMHLHIVLAFVLLIWWPREDPLAPLVQSVSATWCVVLAQLLFISCTAWIASNSALRTLAAPAGGPQRAREAWASQRTVGS